MGKMYSNRLSRFGLGGALLMFLLACNGDEMTDVEKSAVPAPDLNAQALHKIADLRIFFGHQSVGGNIVQGIQDVLKTNPQIRLNVVETTEPARFSGPIFAHANIGRNEAPETKNEAFAEFVGKSPNIDVAFYKYCYVDINRYTHVQKMFDEYRQTADKIKSKNPRLIFVHVTAPLTVIQTGPKAWLKRIVGKPVGGYEENKRRYEFNEMIRAAYGKTDPIFDLAKLESTLPGGARVSYKYDGHTYYALAPGYSDDGGHLNEMGRKYIASRLLVFLSNLTKT